MSRWDDTRPLLWAPATISSEQHFPPFGLAPKGHWVISEDVFDGQNSWGGHAAGFLASRDQDAANPLQFSGQPQDKDYLNVPGAEVEKLHLRTLC